MKRHSAVLLFLLFASGPAFAAELELRYQALERLMGEELFTQDGRHYVRGDKNSKCQFAYLASPHVNSKDGLLRLSARFSGRSALDMLGRCVGLGDSFDFTLTGAPIVRNGALALKDVNVTSPRDSYYIRRVRQALVTSFSKDFKIDVREQAKRLVANAPTDGRYQRDAPYQRELASFDLREARAESNALVLVVDFRLVIK